MPVNCSVYGCTANSNKCRGLSFHIFPKNIELRKEWIVKLRHGKVPSQNARVCSRHFNEDDYISPLLPNGGFKNRYLKSNVVPSQNLPTSSNPTRPARATFIRSLRLAQRNKRKHNRNADLPPNCDDSDSVLRTDKSPKLNNCIADELKIEHEQETEACHEESYFSDPAFLDHDYIVTEKPNEQQKLGVPEDNKPLCSQLVLEDVRKELCRLCGQKGTLLRPIFDSLPSETDEEVSLSTKIDMYLPFKVKMGDPLPCHICLQCFEVLNRWHELYVTCVAADAVLWKTFGGQFDVSSQKNQESSTDRDQDSNNQCADNSDPLSDTEHYEGSTTVDADSGLNETKEECEVLCSVCGMNTSSRPSKEEDFLIEEFENFYSQVLSVKYKCTYCFEFFLNPRAKKEHLKNCRELSTICEICGKDDVFRKDLQKHKYVKHQQVIVTRACDNCGQCFKSLSALNKHINLVHGQGLIPKVCCRLCCSAFVDEQNYRIHQKKHEKGIIKTVFQIEEHIEGEGVYVCPVCEEVFNDTLSFVVHLNSKKDLKCLSCQKQITSEKKFLLHVCGEWNCRYCPKTCKTKIQWIVHERLHTGEKPINCRVCDKSFRSFQLRTRHETTHAPAFQCSICGKNFRNKYVFQDHLQCHEGRVFLCPVCHKGFSGRKNVKKHMKAVHKGIKARIV